MKTVTTISLDRAKAVANAAVAAGLATPPGDRYVYAEEFRTLLSALGVETIMQLDGDQAEELERELLGRV